MRIDRHPILDIPEKRKMVTIFANGYPIQAYQGETVAAALMATGIKSFRKTKKYGKMRGIFCAIGRCTDCAATINGIPNIRCCVTIVEDGMQIEIQGGTKTWRQEM